MIDQNNKSFGSEFHSIFFSKSNTLCSIPERNPVLDFWFQHWNFCVYGFIILKIKTTMFIKQIKTIMNFLRKSVSTILMHTTQNKWKRTSLLCANFLIMQLCKIEREKEGQSVIQLSKKTYGRAPATRIFTKFSSIPVYVYMCLCRCCQSPLEMNNEYKNKHIVSIELQ